MSADPGPTRSIALSSTPERVLRRLEWRVIRRLDGRLQGDYRTLFHGVGIDFADLREYESGDDVTADDVLDAILARIPMPSGVSQERRAPVDEGAWAPPPR